jgi:Uma2 family endonuclease
MTATITPSIPQNRVILQGVQWATYQALVHDLESRPSKRLTYDCGVLEITMPWPPHEANKKLLARLVELITEELGVEVKSLGSTTWSREDLAKGIEPDECYYIQNELGVRGRTDINLPSDPPPDLAIEVDITSPSLPRLPIYRALGVPEVWRFDGQQVRFLVLVEGDYQDVSQSAALPLITPLAVQMLRSQAQGMGETSWARLVRSWVREQMGS